MSTHPASPFDRALQRLKAAFWRRRFVLGLVRTAWLVLLPPTIVQAGYLWLGWQVSWTTWLAASLGIGLVSLLWAARPVNEQKLIARLDAGLGLRARLSTAYEVSRRGTADDNPVVHRLLQEAVAQLVDLRSRVRLLTRHLWLEVQALLGVLAMLVALVLVDALRPNLPEATVVALPTPLPEPSAEQVLPPEPPLLPPPFPPDMQAADAQALQRALEALAEALRDPAATRSAAEAIDQGDLPAAASELRRLADRLDDLSETARQELGQAFGEAADSIDSIGGDAPSLTGPLRQGEDALGRDDLLQAGEALESLARGITSAPAPVAQTPPETAPAEENEPSEAGAEPSSPEAEGDTGTGGGEGQSGAGSQPDEAERLAVEGQPLELESGPETEALTLQPAELDAAPGDRTTTGSPFSRGSPLSADDLGPDPLAYPWDRREVVKRYFSP